MKWEYFALITLPSFYSLLTQLQIISSILSSDHSFTLQLPKWSYLHFWSTGSRWDFFFPILCSPGCRASLNFQASEWEIKNSIPYFALQLLKPCAVWYKEIYTMPVFRAWKSSSQVLFREKKNSKHLASKKPQCICG